MYSHSGSSTRSTLYTVVFPSLPDVSWSSVSTVPGSLTPDFAPSLSCWRYSLSLASLSTLDSAGASSLTTKGTINFFCNPFSFTSHTNARLPRLNPSLTLDRSSPSRTLHLLDSLVYTRREASCSLRHHVQASRLNQARASPRALVLIAMLTN